MSGDKRLYSSLINPKLEMPKLELSQLTSANQTNMCTDEGIISKLCKNAFAYHLSIDKFDSEGEGEWKSSSQILKLIVSTMFKQVPVVLKQ